MKFLAILFVFTLLISTGMGAPLFFNILLNLLSGGKNSGGGIGNPPPFKPWFYISTDDLSSEISVKNYNNTTEQVINDLSTKFQFINIERKKKVILSKQI